MLVLVNELLPEVLAPQQADEGTGCILNPFHHANNLTKVNLFLFVFKYIDNNKFSW
jgi:hypothetical protein